MPRYFVPALCVCLLTGPGTAGPVETTTPPNPWVQFPIGSWLVIRTKTTSGGQTAGQRVKLTIVGMEKNRPVVGMAREINGQFQTPFRAGRQVNGFWPSQLGMRLRTTESSSHTIDGRPYHCTVEKYEVEDPPHRLIRNLTLWRARQIVVPYREIVVDRGANVALMSDVVKAEYRVAVGPRTTTYKLEVLHQDEPLTIGGRTVKCTLEKADAVVEGNNERISIETERWLSSLVPGHVVKTRGVVHTPRGVVEKEQWVEAFGVTQ